MEMGKSIFEMWPFNKRLENNNMAPLINALQQKCDDNRE